MQKLAILALFILLSFQSISQIGTIVNRGAASLAMGGTYLTHENEYSLYSNPANFASSTNLSLHASAEQRFLRSELLNASFGIAKRISPLSTIAIGFNSFGIDEYKEITARVGYARKILDNLNLGVQFNYYQFRITEYGSKSVFNAEIGVSSQVTKELLLAAHLINPFRIDIAENSKLPAQLNLGVKYTVSPKANLRIELHKEIDFEEQIKIGVEYSPIDVLKLRVGFSTNPGAVGFGIGLKLNERILIDLGFQTHQYLSPTPGFSIIYSN